MKFESEGREFDKLMRSQEQFFRTVKGQYNFSGKQNAFLTSSWRSNTLEQL